MAALVLGQEKSRQEQEKTNALLEDRNTASLVLSDMSAVRLQKLTEPYHITCVSVVHGRPTSSPGSFSWVGGEDSNTESALALLAKVLCCVPDTVVHDCRKADWLQAYCFDARFTVSGSFDGAVCLSCERNLDGTLLGVELKANEPPTPAELNKNPSAKGNRPLADRTAACRAQAAGELFSWSFQHRSRVSGPIPLLLVTDMIAYVDVVL